MMLQPAGVACHKSVRRCTLRLLCQEARIYKCMLPVRTDLQLRAHCMHSQITRSTHQVVCSSSAVAAEVVTVAEPQAAPNPEIPASRLVLRPNEVWYFAYGSNMNVDTLRRRRVKPLDSLPATSPGYVLTFSQSGFPYAEPCFASLDPAGPQHRDSPEAHGVLHRLRSQEWEQIQRSEGVGMDLVGYKPISVTCCLYNGHQVRAQTLTTSPLSVSPNNRRAMASERYLDLLRKGAVYHGVAPGYCEWLASLPSYDAPVSTRALGQLAVQASALLAFGPMLALASTYTIATNVLADQAVGENVSKNRSIRGKHERGSGKAGNQSGGTVSKPTSSNGGNNSGGSSSSRGSGNMGRSSNINGSSNSSSRSSGGSSNSSSSRGSSSNISISKSSGSSYGGSSSGSNSSSAGSRHSAQEIGDTRLRGGNESVQDLAWKTVLLTFGLTQRAAWSAHDVVWRHVVGDGAAKADDS